MADTVYETFPEWHREKCCSVGHTFDPHEMWEAVGWNARQPQVDALTAQVEALKEQNENLERNVTGKHRHIREMEESIKALTAICALPIPLPTPPDREALMNRFIDALEDWADLDDDQRTARAAEVLLVEALAAWKLAKGGAK